MILAGGIDAATVPDLLHQVAARTPDTVALIAASAGDVAALRSVTYAELESAARRVAAGLRDQGVRTGDRVGILLDNSCAVEAAATYHAGHLLGAVDVPLNTRCVPAELAGAITVAGITTVVTDTRLRDTVAAVRDAVGHRLTVVEVDHRDTADHEPAAPSPDAAWRDLLTAEPLDGRARVSGDDDADWIFSSGTTGAPKAARFTHAASVACGDGVARAWSLAPGDVYQSSAPFSTSTGVHTNPLGALAAGATYLVDPDPSLVGFLERARTHGTTVCFLVTTLLTLLVEDHRDAVGRLPRLRRVVYGGMAVPAQRHLRLHEVLTTGLGIELMHLMGLTEGGPTGLYLDPADHARKPGSIGDRPFSPDVAFTIVDDDGHPVAPGAVGEIRYRGPSVTSGYLHEDPAAPAVVDGWLRTGDLVRRDDDGFVWFVDRTKDIVRRGGLNVAASEVESVLLLAPGVVAAAVVAKPHPVLGEDLCAFLEVDSPVRTDALREFCRGHLADFKVPRDIRIVDALPRNGMGRVTKAVLRDAVNTAGD